MTPPPFLAVELTAGLFATQALPDGYALAALPASDPEPAWTQLERQVVLRASDGGYRTRAADPGGVVAYPPLLLDGLQLDRTVPLAPDQIAVTYTLGQLQLINPDQRWDDTVASGNIDGRPVRILTGTPGWDAARQLAIDPPYASLTPLWVGVGRPWMLGIDELSVPVQDNSYLLTANLRAASYGGTGGRDGDAQAKGKAVPTLRGGTPADPLRQVAPVLIDAVRLIYQVSDAPGIVLALYERGDGTTITGDGQVTDVFGAGAPAAGHWCWSSSAAGLYVQLGTSPFGTITVDAVGAFRTVGQVGTVADLARSLVVEELGVPAALLDAASWTAAAAECPYPAGLALDGTTTTGIQALGLVLAGTGLRIVPRRDGTLGLQRLRAPSAAEGVAASWTTAQIVSVTPVSLGAALDPPALRWRLGWGRLWTVQASGTAPTLTAAQQQELATEWRYAASVERRVALSYRAPSDPQPLATALLRQADAQACADALAALWTAARTAYQVAVPVDLATGIELFDQLRIACPLGPLRGGAVCRVVGEQIRTGDGTALLTVIV